VSSADKGLHYVPISYALIIKRIVSRKTYSNYDWAIVKNYISKKSRATTYISRDNGNEGTSLYKIMKAMLRSVLKL
jgi:hypothetical protein